MAILPFRSQSHVLTGTTRFKVSQEFRNILITGGAGFIGSWLTRHLVTNYAEAYRVIVMDNLSYCASLNNLSSVEDFSNFTMVHGDIKDESDVLRIMKRYNIDAVIHLAAQSHVDQSFTDSYKFTNDNVGGTHTLLQCATRVGVRRFIHVSTDEVTGEVATDAADLPENAVLMPTNPYAASKAAAEMYVNAFARSFQLPTIVVRLNNVYGPHQFPEKLIPKLCCLIMREQPLPLHGDGHNTRRYIYASDAVDALDTVLHRGKIGETYHIASKDEVSNLCLASQMLEAFAVPKGVHRSKLVFVPDRPFNDTRYATDGTKLKRLGWMQKIGFEEGLRRTMEWYREFGFEWWGDVTDVVGSRATGAAAFDRNRCSVECLQQIPINRDVETNGV